MIKLMLKSKKGDLQLDEMGKLILGLVLLIILIVIITVVIRGELFSTGNDIGSAFDIFK